MAHATNDISAVRMYIGPAVMYSVDTLTKFILIIGIMISLAPLLTFYTLIPLPFLSFYTLEHTSNHHRVSRQEEVDDLFLCMEVVQ